MRILNVSSKYSHLLFLSLVTMGMHLLAMTHYGYFRDELYYAVCGDHLAWGYVDQPVLSILILKIQRALFGDSLWSLRMIPAINHCIVVFMAGVISERMGGKRFAQSVAGLCALIAPVYLGMNHLYSMNTFDILFWTIGAYLLVMILTTEKNVYWYLLGLDLGLGLMNKISVLWLGFGIAVGFTTKYYRKKEFWIAGLIALLFILPYVFWNIANGYPTLEFMKNAAADKYVPRSALQFLIGITMLMNPFTFPVWIAGLVGLFFIGSLKRFRRLGIVFLCVLAILLADRTSKSEYFAASFAMMFAAGGVAIELFVNKLNRVWLKAVTIAVILVGLIAVPFGLPLLPVEKFIAYEKWLGAKPESPEKQKLEDLNQFYADMFGWENWAVFTSNQYLKLSAQDRANCVTFSHNYGEAAALDFFRAKYALPPVVCGHNNYYFWHDTNLTAKVWLVPTKDPNWWRARFASVDSVGFYHCAYIMPYENDYTFYICRGMKISSGEFWNLARGFE